MRLNSLLPAGAVALALALPAAAQTRQLCTIFPFAGGNGLSGDTIVFFDVTASIPVIIQSLDTNCYAAAASVAFEVYTTPGTWVGNNLNPAAWTLVARDNGTAVSTGPQTVTNVVLQSPLLLPVGSYGMALRCSAGHSYTNGNGTNQSFSNADLALSLGAATTVPAATGPFTSTTLNNPRVWNGCINYVPGVGLYPGFSATPTSGPSPLNVQFTDQTFTSDPGGITSWSWDVDGDNVTDYTTQNPSHTYTAGGTYSVTLTVTDSTFGTRSLTKTDYVVADPIAADFTATPTFGALPLLVQFTDTTTGNPIAWAWDFDNDGTIDSTLQNPTWTYTSAGRFSVRLATTNGANADSITKTDLITVVGPTNNTRSAEILEFQFNEPRGSKVHNTASTTTAPAFGTVTLPAGPPNVAWQGDPGRHGFMGNDVGTGCLAADNTTPYEARVDTGYTIDLASSHTLMFWTRMQAATAAASYAFGGTVGSARCYHTGSQWSLRNWGSLGTAYVLSATDADTLVGWNHWAMVLDNAAGTAQWYLNGVADGAALSFTPGSFTATGLGTLIVGDYSTLTSSHWTRYADMDDFRLYARALTPAEILAAMASENPATSTFGDGCSGPSAVPTVGATGGAPALANASFAITVGNLETGVPQVLNIGIYAITNSPLPIDLAPFLGATYTGCSAELLPDFTGVGLGGSSSAVVALPLPNDPNLAGWHLYAQAIALGSVGAVSPALDVNMQM